MELSESDLPGNSHAKRTVVREERVVKTTKTQTPPPKKIEKVVTTDAVRKKPSLGKKFLDTFIRGHAKTAWDFVLFDVLVPSAKDMIANSVSQGIDQMVYGDSRTSSRRREPRSVNRGAGSTLVGHTSYDRITDRRREEPRTRTERGRHDFDDILLATRAEADIVIERLCDLIEVYDQASVADLYELIGETGNFTDERWGWTDMRGADSQRVRNGDYRLILPKPEPLK